MENEELTENRPTEAEQNEARKKQPLRAWLRFFVILAMMPVVFALIAALLLIGHDITAPSWVTKRIEARAEADLNGGDLNFEDISFSVGKDLHPRVRMKDVSIVDASGRQVLGVESVTGLFSPRGAVLEGRALMQDVTVSGMDLDLRRDSDGALALSFGESGQDFVIEDSLQAVFAQIDSALSGPALEALESVNASDVSISFQDEATGQFWSGISQDLRLELKGDERRIGTAFRVKTAGSDAASLLRVSYLGEKDVGAAQLNVELEAATGQDLEALLPQIAGAKAIDAPIKLNLTAKSNEGDTPTPIAARINIGKGIIRHGAGQDLQLQGFNTTLELSRETKQIRLRDLALRSERLSFTGHGRIAQEGDASSIGQFQFDNVALSLPNELPEPLNFETAFADIRVQTNPLRVDIGSLYLNNDDVSVQTSGQLERTDQGLSAFLDFQVPEVGRETILEYWPLGRVPNTRRWFSNNLKATKIEALHGALRLKPNEKPNWSLGFDFSETELRVVRDTPHIKAARGTASFAQGAFGLLITDGHISAAEGGRIDVAGTSVDIADINDKNGPMAVNIVAESPLTATLSVLDQSPVQAMQKARLPVDVASARSRLIGTITFPRINPIPKDAFDYDIIADLAGFSSDELVKGRSLTARRMTVAVDNDGLVVGGAARLDGVPLTGTYAQAFGKVGGILDAEMEISPKSLSALNIALPPGSVAGRGAGALRVNVARDQVPDFTLTSDLRGLRVAIPAIGWAKSANASGNLFVEGTLGERPDVSDLQISGGGLTARGRIGLTSEGQLEAARFSQLQIGNWFNAPLTLRGRGEGRPPAVEIAGGALDLRRARFGPRRGEGGPVTIALDRLIVTSGVSLSNFRGEFASAGGFNGNFQGSLNGGTSVRGTVVPQNGRSAIRLRSDDAGGIIRAAGLMKGATGGALDLVLSPVGQEGTFDGDLNIRGLRVRDASGVAALLDAISVVGLLQQLDGQGLSFDEVDARFRLTPSQVIVSQSSATGPGLGISLDGVYALASKQLDFQGVISPLYLLNGIGSFLTRKGEGLIGFNFTVKGDASAPQVGVNPLSALTPGMFREIFRRPAPELGQ